MRRRRPRCSPTLAVVALATSAGCTVPNFQGPQIQEPPLGFLRQNDSYQARRMFPERTTIWHTAWIKANDGPYSAIYVNAHAGVLTIDDVADAQQQARLAARHPEITFGDIEAMTIDGRTAWGWAERLETRALGLDWVAYRAVVAYDTVSYAIEFYAGDPRIKPAAPDTLKTVIASFGIGETRMNLPIIAMLAGMLLLGANVMRTRAQKKTARLASINLVKIPKKDEEKSGAGPAATGAAGGSAPPPAATSPKAAARPIAPPAAPSAMRRPTGDGGGD